MQQLSWVQGVSLVRLRDLPVLAESGVLSMGIVAPGKGIGRAVFYGQAEAISGAAAAVLPSSLAAPLAASWVCLLNYNLVRYSQEMLWLWENIHSLLLSLGSSEPELSRGPDNVRDDPLPASFFLISSSLSLCSLQQFPPVRGWGNKVLVVSPQLPAKASAHVLKL